MKRHLILVSPKLPESAAQPEAVAPLSMLYLAGAAKGHCDRIIVVDMDVPIRKGKTTEDLLSAISAVNEEDCKLVVGIGCLYSALFPTVSRLSREIKEAIPSAVVVCGGMHCTLYAEDIMHNVSSIDAILLGESDTTFPQLLDYYYSEKTGKHPREYISDGYCIRQNGELTYAPKTSLVCDLDTLAHPAYELFDWTEYEVNTSNWYSPDGLKISRAQMPIFTSRGCPWRCNFCSMEKMMGTRFRYHSAKRVVEEIKDVYDNYGINYFNVLDDNFAFNRDRAVAICNGIIESGMKVNFATPNGISIKTLDLDLLKLMRKAGFIMLSLAVESGSDYIRNTIMGKRISREQIVNAFHWCKVAGIFTRAFIIIGMPEETEQTLLETYDLLDAIPVNTITLSAATPLPGTRLYDQCVRDNLFIDESYAYSWGGDNSDNPDSNYFGKAKTTVKSAYVPHRFRIKPYNLSLERMAEIDMELQALVANKCRDWRERVRKNNEIVTLKGEISDSRRGKQL